MPYRKAVFCNLRKSLSRRNSYFYKSVRMTSGSNVRENIFSIESSKKPKIAVIGAGTSGLRAAEVLIEAGCEVLVLEARDRYGGRIATSSKLGKPVDLGANWIHGNEGNPVTDIAERAHAVYKNSDLSSTQIIASDGTHLPQKLGDDISTRMWTYFEEGIEYSEENWESIDPQERFYDYYQKRAEEDESNEVKRKYQMQIVELLGGIVANDIKRQGLRNMYLEKPIPGDDLFLSTTYGPIMELMAETVLKHDCLKLNIPVESVHTTHAETGPVHEIQTKGGESFKADGLVVTIPLGSLKRDRITFEPAIPQNVKQSIQNLGFGSLEKTLISFPKAFWGSSGPSFFTFLAPDFAPDTNKEQWQMTIISLAHLPKPHDQPTLLLYMHEPASKHITDIFQNNDEAESRRQILEFFRPYVARLPNYSAEDANCQPVDLLVTNWINDEYAGNGSYTNFPVGLVDGAKDIKTIRDGVKGQRLWFCGEHTAPLLGLATVCGAYWAGEITARRCLVEFGLMSKELEEALIDEEPFS